MDPDLYGFNGDPTFPVSHILQSGFSQGSTYIAFQGTVI